jgi:hypothetical protein
MLTPERKCKEPNITFKITEDVAIEVLSLDDVKEYLTIDFPDHDWILNKLIKGVRQSFERWTGLAIGVKKIELSGDYESDLAYMPLEPINDQVGALQTVGYDRNNCPDDIQVAMMKVIHACFENRELDINKECEKASKGFRRRVGL